MSLSFNFPRPTAKVDDLEDLYEAYGVDRSVILDLAGTHETPKTMREGYYGAYHSFFHSCGLIFPIPETILEIMAELGLSLTQILPNFLRYLIAFLVRAREEGLSFGLSEFRQLVLEKRNQQNPGTFLVSPRPGRHVIEDIPYRDQKWREQFFVFKMDRASMAPSGSSSMSDEIRGLIGILRRDRSNWSTFDQARIRAVFAIPEGTDRAPVFGGSEDEAEHSQEGAIFWKISLDHDSDDEDVLGERRPLVSLSPGLGDETVAATRERRQSSEGALPGSSRPRFVPEGDGSLFAAQSDLIFLAGRMRSAGCHLPSLASSVEKEAYAQVAVASSKAFEGARSHQARREEGCRKDRGFDRRLEENSLGEEALMTQMVAQKARIAALEVERDRDIRRASRIARRAIATWYREILESLKDKWTSKKKEVFYEIQLQEVIANIDLLNELKDEGLTGDAELARLKEMEGYCEDLVASAASDWSISELDLPQVSNDSADQIGGSSVPDDSASS
ncbi:hypothetical protein F2Q69_00028404 [Brassica cretica]|uniref:Uncharacterized protein n=1 Tax=Brassica cretica TaxID=69181 RepID=A0A8S9RRZ6_BRACR|nr:hypothetical protein F2Q69_00028404 [Brassica cretica]